MSCQLRCALVLKLTMAVLLHDPHASILGGATCSVPCWRDSAAWVEHSDTLILKADNNTRGKERNAQARAKNFAHLCSGMECVFLRRADRSKLLNRVLRGIGYHGASAEIGVWQGAMSLAIMRANPSMGRHLSVDPWIGHMGGCDKLADRHCAMIRGKNGALVRKANNTKFDGMHRNVVTSLSSYFPRRSLVVRNFSVEASRLIPDSSLDFIYIDGRHDLAGVSEDLASWWPKLCRGGLLGGHDWIGNGQAAQALRKWIKSQPFGTTGRPPRVYITAENPASYFTFREPCRW